MLDPLAFYALAALTVGCAVAVVSVRNIFHAGLFLIGTFLGVAGLYVSLHNYFLAAMQLLIYSGAVAVLILFGIMMTQKLFPAREPSHNALWMVGIPVTLGLLAFLLRGLSRLPPGKPVPPPQDLLQGIGNTLMKAYLLPFEIISLVLLVALVGAMAIAREKE